LVQDFGNDRRRVPALLEAISQFARRPTAIGEETIGLLFGAL
jgi:hypothetical protein